MKKRYLLLLPLLFIIFSAQDCCDDPVQTQAGPFVGIDVIYKDALGNEVIKSFNSDMPDPESLLGFEVFLPESDTEYTLLLVGRSDACIRDLKLEKKDFKNTGAMQPIDAHTVVVLEKDLSSCAKKQRVASTEKTSHADRRRYYLLNCTDFFNKTNGVDIIIIPPQ